MKVFTFIVSSLLVLILAIILGFRILNTSIEYPHIVDEWWGATQEESARQKDVVIEEMKPIHFPEEALEDLNHRLTNTRFFQPLEGTHWEYGTSIEDLKQIVQYWLKQFDWRKQEKLLNSFNHYTATIDGIKVHYLHAKPTTKTNKVIPILLIHGWPGSFFEFYNVIPLLISDNSEGDFSFEVICPSLPGYIFSEAPHKPGLHSLQVSKMFIKLMAALSFKSYYVQGGDWGSFIGRSIGVMDSSHVKGVHLNMFTASPPYGPFSLLSAYISASWNSSTDHGYKDFYSFKNLFFKILRETGYFHLQATKPESIGVALNDSPVGLAAYIIEKFFTWSGCKRNDSITCLDSHFTKDELLTNVMLYWLTNSMPSAMRLYKEMQFDRSLSYPLTIPTGLADFPNDLFTVPYSWLQLPYPHIVQYTTMSRGGHFAALEEPQLLANDIWKFVKKVELTLST